MILVTGGCGFIGSNLVDRLIEMGEEVVVMDNLSTGKAENLNSQAELIGCNVQDFERFHMLPKFDVIFHLAALARIQPSFHDPKTTYEANALGTWNMLELARYQGCKVVYAGSSSAYHDIHANPYTYTKWIGEEHCKLYNKVYGIPIGIARFFNVYGPRQIEDGAYATVIGVFERQRREGKPLTVTGTGEQRRDFTHVYDIVEGLIGLWKKEAPAQIYNFGTGVNYSINEVAEMFNHPYEHIPKRPGEAWITLADITEAKQDLGYEPTYNLEDYIWNKTSNIG